MCLTGRPNLCLSFNHIGQDSDGGFAGFAVAPAANAHHLPEQLSFAAGALVEPFAGALHCLQRARFHQGEDVLIVGDGFFGQVFTQLARALGAGRIVVLGHHAERLAKAREEGADVALDERGGEVTATAAGLGEGCGPDVTIATVTTGGAFALALDLAGRGGRIGIFGASSLPFATPTRPITAKELDIFGSRGNPGVWPDLIALMAEGRVKPERLISRTMPLDDLPHAFVLKASRAVSLSKIVLQP